VKAFVSDECGSYQDAQPGTYRNMSRAIFFTEVVLKDEDFGEIDLLKRRLRMKRSSRIHQYIKRFGLLLIVVVLVMGLASCDGSCSSAPAEYDLITSSSEGGNVVIAGEGTYLDGTVVMIEAVANECYEFVEWTGAEVADPYSTITTVTMDEVKSVTANFALLSYDLTTDSTDGGEVTSPDEDTITYDCGMVVDLVATPDAYYGFVEWTGDVDTIANVYAASTTITIKGHYSVTANFSLFAGGNGTEENPYQIADWYHLDNVRNYLSSYFILTNDLDSNSIGYTELASVIANEGKGWQPIGTIAVNDAFVGSFDGQGYEIRDLFINRSGESDVGLFGVVEEGGVIENVGVAANGNVVGNGDVGVLVGKNEGNVSSSYCTGNVTGNLNIGGLVGWNFGGTVTDSYSTGSVTGLDNVGGLVGWNTGTTSNSYAIGSVTGNTSVGGLAGKNAGTASNSYATGNVTGDDNVGGLVGKNDNTGTVSNSYATGNVAGELHVGGLMGRNQGTESNSFWDTETSGQANSDGGTGKTTEEMKDISTFSGASWNIVIVDNADDRNTGYTWNIVDTVTYPFLSWQSVV
jgi:hypothetical protein